MSASGCETDIAAVAFDEGAARHVDPLRMESLVCGVRTWAPRRRAGREDGAGDVAVA